MHVTGWSLVNCFPGRQVVLVPPVQALGRCPLELQENAVYENKGIIVCLHSESGTHKESIVKKVQDFSCQRVVRLFPRAEEQVPVRLLFSFNGLARAIRKDKNRTPRSLRMNPLPRLTCEFTVFRAVDF
uniref:Uncharacterized protein n=1 Tax=Tetraselmis sp. GSL018 TaxID=582737 RepID=A0A061RT15_9CHLO